jgi:hypothetical protein
MAELNADQLTDIRADLGDDGTVFTDDELHRLYTRAGGDYNKAVVLALRQILMNAAKLSDYRIAQSAESRSQVYKQLREQLAYWEEVARNTQQIRVVGLRAVPPRAKDVPSE